MVGGEGVNCEKAGGVIRRLKVGLEPVGRADDLESDEEKTKINRVI